MTPEQRILQLLTNFKLPAQELEQLSFCHSNKSDVVRRWVEELPATRISQTSALLYQALPEVTRLKTTADTRLKMLESLRPFVQQCIQGLAKNFLNQPLILPQGAMKTAVVAQALQKHMSNGYTLVAKEYLLQPEKTRKLNTERLALSLHRSVTGMGLQILRSYQLYTQAPPNLWMEAHNLYRLAETLQLQKLPVKDELLDQQKSNTIEQSYMRLLLLSCANSNQLNQADVGVLYRALEEWAKQVHLTTSAGDHIFSVNLNGDFPPNYTKRYTNNSNTDLRAIDLDTLLYELNKLNKGESSHKVKRPALMNTPLFNHCINTWGAVHERENSRHPSQGNMDAIVGLSALHFHLCGEKQFNEFLRGGQSLGSHSTSKYKASELSHEYDPWSKVIDHNGIGAAFDKALKKDEGQGPCQSYPIFSVERVDASPGGYCLQWHGEIPTQVKSGEILGLREPNRRMWAIGVIRWAKQNRGATQLGIQLLAPNAEPYAAQVVSKTGESGEFMRALVLPELKQIKQPASLLTPARPFQAQQKIKLNHQGITDSAILTECIFATSGINQFYYRELDTGGDGSGSGTKAAKAKSAPPRDDFNSSWD